MKQYCCFVVWRPTLTILCFSDLNSSSFSKLECCTVVWRYLTTLCYGVCACHVMMCLGTEDALCAESKAMDRRDCGVSGGVPGSRTSRHHHINGPQQWCTHPTWLPVQPRISPQPKGLVVRICLLPFYFPFMLWTTVWASEFIETSCMWKVWKIFRFRELSTQSSSTNITAHRFSYCAPPFGIVFPHLYALLIASLVLGLSSRLVCPQDICSRSAVRASDPITRSFVTCWLS